MPTFPEWNDEFLIERYNAFIFDCMAYDILCQVGIDAK